MLKNSVFQYDNQFFNVQLYYMTLEIQNVIYEKEAWYSTDKSWFLVWIGNLYVNI